MRKSNLSHSTCTVARTVELIGDSWTQMILREMFLGSRRFEDLKARTGAVPHVLSQRLKRLEAEAILERRAYSDRPPRHEYKLTAKGRDLWPIIVAMKQWGDTWLGGDGEPPITLTHTECGQVTRPRLVCSACGEPIRAVTSRAHISEDMQRERAARPPIENRKGRTS